MHLFEKLVFSGASLHITCTSPSPVLSHSFQLTELVVSRCSIAYGAISQLLDSTSWSKLRTVVVKLSPSDVFQTIPILSHYQGMLERLHPLRPIILLLIVCSWQRTTAHYTAETSSCIRLFIRVLINDRLVMSSFGNTRKLAIKSPCKWG
ncbi:hypothetical protein K439DRAFT_316559 [Ramaria rubella]|nr:hypothetical protein K439DRAFT_316559 [Ramaria rubella]